MLDQIVFSAGSPDKPSPLEVSPGRLIILIGPNNSGKSLALRELEGLLTQQGRPRVVVNELKWRPFDSATDFEAAVSPGVIERRDGTLRFLGNQSELLPLDAFNGYRNSATIQSTIGKYLTLRLDGASRLRLTEDQSGVDLLRPPESALAALFLDSLRRGTFRQMIYDAFGYYPVIDPTALGRLRLRMSSRPPSDEDEEQGFSTRARQFQSAATPIAHLSDGVRAFSGILLSVLSSHYLVTLLDEPEAFLHPALARKLGHNLGRIAAERRGHVVVATHSPEFLMGCVEAGETCIVRLTYRDGLSTAQDLSAAELRTMMRQPLLRSTNVLSGLFHEGVVVTEGDSDRAFYQEISYRLNEAGATLFINAQNKQTVSRLLAPLRRMGIPSAGILDIDVLKDGGKDWKRLLQAAGIPDAQADSLCTLRSVLLGRFPSDRNMKTEGGIDLLSADNKESALSLFRTLEEHGIFVVRNGEVESWLKNLAVEGKKSDWLVNIFDCLGADSNSPDYVNPGVGDVWDFLRSVGRWIRDPNRRGMHPQV